MAAPGKAAASSHKTSQQITVIMAASEHPAIRADVEREAGVMKGARLLAACAVTTSLWNNGATAQQSVPQFPALIRIVVTSGAGSAPDLVARLIGPKLEEKLKRPVVIENRPGANGSIGAGEVARSAPDGGTLLVSTSGTVTANLALYPKTATGLIASLEPVTEIADVDFIIAARADLGVRTLPELMARMKAEPGKITVATGPHGSFPHLAAEMLKQQSRLDFVIAKNQTGPNAATSVAGGHTDVVIDTAAVIQPFLDAGHVMALASTGTSRDPATPSLPTAEEAGLAGYAMSGWIGLMAPKDTPIAVRDALQVAVADGVRDPATKQRFAGIQFRPVASDVATFAKFWNAEKERLGRVIRNGNLAVE